VVAALVVDGLVVLAAPQPASKIVAKAAADHFVTVLLISASP